MAPALRAGRPSFSRPERFIYHSYKKGFVSVWNSYAIVCISLRGSHDPALVSKCHFAQPAS